VKKAIGTRIRKLRVSKDLKQDNMATELDITAGAYAKIERGETDPSATRLIQIAKILGVEVGYFFQDDLFIQALSDKNNNHQYGNNNQQAFAEMASLVNSLKTEMEKMKAELASIKKSKSKK